MVLGSGDEEAVELVPLGTLRRLAAPDLAARISRHVHLPCRVAPDLPPFAPQMPGRGQLDADALLAALEVRAAVPGPLLVGVTDEDIAIPIFTFVFGRARQHGRAAVVSLARLDPAFYGLPPDPERTARRAVAEVLHELGHVAGRAHCPDGSCLMSFAGNVDRVDVRGLAFCPACRAELPGWLRPL